MATNRRRTRRTPKTLLLIGTNHDCQVSGSNGFGALVEATCRDHKVEAIGEELNLDVLRKIAERLGLDPRAGSACRRVADTLSIAHCYCDPTIEEQKALGIADPCRPNPWAWSCIPPDPKDLDPEVRDAHKKRECEWRLRVLALDTWPMLFVCGSHHVDAFRALLEDEGIKVEVLFRMWPCDAPSNRA